MCELMLSYTSIYFKTFHPVFVVVCVQDMVPVCGNLQVLLRHIPFLLHVCTGKLKRSLTQDFRLQFFFHG